MCSAIFDCYVFLICIFSEPSVLTPTLWVGTSLGSVLTILITTPEPDSRSSQPVVVSMVGMPIFRLKGGILTLSFLDCSGALIPYTFETWKDDNREKRERDSKQKSFPTMLLLFATTLLTKLTWCGVSGTPTRTQNRMSPTLGESRSDNFSDRQFVVIASEKQARVLALPSQNCVYRQQLADTDFVVKAEVISFKGSFETILQS